MDKQPNLVQANLSADLSAVATVLTFETNAIASLFTQSTPTRTRTLAIREDFAVSPNQENTEFVKVVSIANNNVTVERAQENSTALAFTTGAYVAEVATDGTLSDIFTRLAELTARSTGITEVISDNTLTGTGVPGRPLSVVTSQVTPTNGTSFDVVYRRSSQNLTATPTGGQSANGQLTSAPNNWSLAVPAGTNTLFISICTISPTNARTYSAPIRLTGADGVGTNGTDGVDGTSVDFIYRRSSQGLTATPAGGQSADGQLTSAPNNWSLAVPAGTDPLYISVCTISPTNVRTYSRPIRLTGADGTGGGGTDTAFSDPIELTGLVANSVANNLKVVTTGTTVPAGTQYIVINGHRTSVGAAATLEGDPAGDEFIPISKWQALENNKVDVGDRRTISNSIQLVGLSNTGSFGAAVYLHRTNDDEIAYSQSSGNSIYLDSLSMRFISFGNISGDSITGVTATQETFGENSSGLEVTTTDGVADIKLSRANMIDADLNGEAVDASTEFIALSGHGDRVPFYTNFQNLLASLDGLNNGNSRGIYYNGVDGHFEVYLSDFDTLNNVLEPSGLTFVPNTDEQIGGGLKVNLGSGLEFDADGAIQTTGDTSGGNPITLNTEAEITADDFVESNAKIFGVSTDPTDSAIYPSQLFYFKDHHSHRVKVRMDSDVTSRSLSSPWHAIGWSTIVSDVAGQYVVGGSVLPSAPAGITGIVRVFNQNTGNTKFIVAVDDDDPFGAATSLSMRVYQSDGTAIAPHITITRDDDSDTTFESADLANDPLNLVTGHSYFFEFRPTAISPESDAIDIFPNGHRKETIVDDEYLQEQIGKQSGNLQIYERKITILPYEQLLTTEALKELTFLEAVSPDYQYDVTVRSENDDGMTLVAQRVEGDQLIGIPTYTPTNANPAPPNTTDTFRLYCSNNDEGSGAAYSHDKLHLIPNNEAPTTKFFCRSGRQRAYWIRIRKIVKEIR